MNGLNIAIVGATGMVGRTFITVLNEKTLPIKNIYFFASSRSAGTKVIFKGKEHEVLLLNEDNIRSKSVNYALFSAGEKISREYAKLFINCGAIVIDNSSAFRMDRTVPLIVPEVNPNDVFWHNGLISNPNCSTIQCMLPLKAINDICPIERVSYVTFQATSGSGMKGLNDLKNTTAGLSPEFYPHPIYNNVLPHIGDFNEHGYSKEEIKMILESRKILGLPSLKVSATCVRVPIENSHSIEVEVKTKKAFKLKDIIESMKNFKNLIVLDNPSRNEYPLATIASGTDYVYVGRIRQDIDDKKTLHFFCVADNIRKGAATNAVQIMELLENVF